MANRVIVNFPLPLPPDLHDQVREGDRRKQQLHTEIVAFASEHGGSNLDLDKELEQVTLEALQALDRQ